MHLQPPEFRPILLVGLLLLLAACCQQRILHHEPARNRFWNEVFIGFGEPEKCPVPQINRPSLLIGLGSQYDLWAKSLKAHNLEQPLASLEIVLSVVDGATGTPVTKYSPIEVSTGLLGLAQLNTPILFAEPGVYRIRAEFDDANSRAIAYSPLIIVQSHTH